MPPDLPHVVRDQVERDAITLRRIVEMRCLLVADCSNCRNVRELDVLSLIASYSPSATLGMIRPKLKCHRCKRRDPYLLMRDPAVRGDKAWYPHAPNGRG